MLALQKCFKFHSSPLLWRQELVFLSKVLLCHSSLDSSHMLDATIRSFQNQSDWPEFENNLVGLFSLNIIHWKVTFAIVLTWCHYFRRPFSNNNQLSENTNEFKEKLKLSCCVCQFHSFNKITGGFCLSKCFSRNWIFWCHHDSRHLSTWETSIAFGSNPAVQCSQINCHSIWTRISPNVGIRSQNELRFSQFQTFWTQQNRYSNR